MSVTMEIPEGKRLVERFSYRVPDEFISCSMVMIENRRFWQPKSMIRYTILVDK